MEEKDSISSFQLIMGGYALKYLTFSLKQDEDYHKFLDKAEARYLSYESMKEAQIDNEKERDNELRLQSYLPQNYPDPLEEIQARMSYSLYLEDPQWGEMSFEDWSMVNDSINEDFAISEDYYDNGEDSEEENTTIEESKNLDKNPFLSFKFPKKNELEKLLSNIESRNEQVESESEKYTSEIDYFENYRKDYLNKIIEDVNNYRKKQLDDRSKELLNINKQIIDHYKFRKNFIEEKVSGKSYFRIEKKYFEPFQLITEELLYRIFKQGEHDFDDYFEE